MKTLGSGLGFPMRSNDGMSVPREANQVNPRADSFSLYLNFVANQVLSTLLPKSKLDVKLHKIVREKLFKQTSNFISPVKALRILPALHELSTTQLNNNRSKSIFESVTKIG